MDIDYVKLMEKRNKDNNYANLLGIRIIDIQEGYAKGEIMIYENHINMINSVHGGCIYSLADTVGGSAAVSRGDVATTISGYGAYWYGSYPDGRVVTKIDQTDWSFSDRVFIEFINELEQYSTWKYSGESELLMIKYKDGIVSFDNMMRFYLENMLRDGAIVSVPVFFQQLFGILSNK